MSLRHSPGDPIDITAWHRLDDRLTSSGQPSEDQLAALAALGVRHVVNLALPSHEKSLADEGGALAALNITYSNIPVNFADPPEADYRAFLAVMDRLAGQTVHVHCILNLRVSAFLYRWRQDRGGVSEAAARAEMERLWKPGGAWARFVGRPEDADLPHRYAGQDYVFDAEAAAQSGNRGAAGLSGAQSQSH
ncbi:MAG: protein tyrosine phosphatase family protein [Novosphingobium sp.]